MLFYHDNAPAHTSAVVTAKLVELGYELLPHPPYSPDVAPCDFFLFPNLKKSLAGQKFASNEEVIAATQVYLAENVFLRWAEEVEATLGQVYRAKGTLCWEVNRNFSKIFDFLL